jgi:hypothetical protein
MILACLSEDMECHFNSEPTKMYDNIPERSGYPAMGDSPKEVILCAVSFTEVIDDRRLHISH